MIADFAESFVYDVATTTMQFEKQDAAHTILGTIGVKGACEQRCCLSYGCLQAEVMSQHAIRGLQQRQRLHILTVYAANHVAFY